MCGMKDQHIQSDHLSNFMNRTVSPPACSPFGQHIVAALSLSARLSAELDLLMKIWKKKNSKVCYMEPRRLRAGGCKAVTSGKE